MKTHPRRLRIGLLAAGVALALGGFVALPAAPPASAAAEVAISMSTMRYCQEETCHSGQFAYVRSRATGPLTEFVNPAGVVDVHPGDRVTWTNVDHYCDFEDGRPFHCPGHNVVFEDGTLRSPLVPADHRIDVTKPGPNPGQFSWVVPLGTAPGTIIRYYCDVPEEEESEPDASQQGGHSAFGMTGVLRVD